MPNVLARRLVVGLGFAVPVLALATGCPLLNKATTPTPTPAPTPNFANQSTDTYTGAVQVFGQPFPGAPTEVQFRNPSANPVAHSSAITTDNYGFFEATNTVIPANSGMWQLVWPVASGATASATTTDFTDEYVSDQLTNPTLGKDSHTPGFTVDIGWHLDPSPSVGGTATLASSPSFSFSTLATQSVAAGPFEYQIFLWDSAKTEWSSGLKPFNPNASGSIQWDGTWQANPASATSPATGSAFYQVKWWTVNATDDTKAFGWSQKIPVTLQ